jgi:hypothetical protein
MVFTTLSLIAFFVLIAWRFVFTGLRRRPLAGKIAALQQQRTNVLGQGLHVLHPAGVAASPDNCFKNGSDGVRPIAPKDRPKAYLRRIVALTGATHLGKGYDISVGTTRFHVRDRYVSRMRDVTDAKCAYEQTCFYSADKSMPKAEQIATALLQLKNNPELFDRWAAQSGAFKADGQAFSSPQ